MIDESDEALDTATPLKSVQQFSKDRVFIKEFISIHEAEKQTGETMGETDWKEVARKAAKAFSKG